MNYNENYAEKDNRGSTIFLYNAFYHSYHLVKKIFNMSFSTGDMIAVMEMDD